MKRIRLLLAAFVVILVSGRRAQAMHPDEFVPPAHLNGRVVILPSFIARNGDWVAVGAVGIVGITPRPQGGHVVATARAEVGVGGAAVALGFGAIIADKPGPLNETLMAGGLLNLDARLARMYGPTSWQNTEYAGVQGSLALPVGMMRLTVGAMVNLRDHTDRRQQFGWGVLF